MLKERAKFKEGYKCQLKKKCVVLIVYNYVDIQTDIDIDR